MSNQILNIGILPGRYKIIKETKHYLFIDCGGIFVIDKDLWKEFLKLGVPQSGRGPALGAGCC